MDANFGLVRKRAGGKSLAPAKKNIFFMDQELVNNKVEGLAYCTKNDIVSNFFHHYLYSHKILYSEQNKG